MSITQQRQIEDVEYDIRNYINAYSEDDFNKVLEKDERWDVFYHLSQMRQSLFNWYTFDETSHLLEIGGEFGALTGLFCERCKQVTCVEESEFRAEAIYERYKHKENLEVYVGKVQEIKFKQEFDYIILVGKLEYMGEGSKGKDKYVAYIQDILSLLKDDGKILIATENRYGIRYLCGARDILTNKPFDGINRYIDGGNAYAFTRQELIRIMESIEGMKYKIYYPLPDYRCPQLIYSDLYLPKSNLRERIIPYYTSKDTIIANEKELYDDIAENGAFPFLSNSFLIECTKGGTVCDVTYAALSTDRGEEHGFATTLHESGQARKTALHNAGIRSLENMYANLMDIKKHNVAIVPQEFKERFIEMPFVQAPTLSDYLKMIIRDDTKTFEEMFEKLYEEILKSSDHISSAKNAFPRHDDDTRDYGVILKHAYIDMIPINCFIKEGKLIFFDQEFKRDNFPANYIMFRALKYTYMFITFANSLVPLQKMKEKFGLTKLWEDYAKEENRFVQDNRDYKTYGNFLEWSKLDKKDIRSNILKLSYK